MKAHSIYESGSALGVLEEKNRRLREALQAVDALWTYDASLGFKQEMSANSPVGIVWKQVREALEN